MMTSVLREGVRSLWTSDFAVPVLDEVLGHLDLADVVVEGARLGQHRVELDFLGRLLGQRGHDERMVVGARGLDGHLPEDREIRVRELQEARGGDEAEDVLENGQEDEGQAGAQQAAQNPHQDLGREGPSPPSLSRMRWKVMTTIMLTGATKNRPARRVAVRRWRR